MKLFDRTDSISGIVKRLEAYAAINYMQKSRKSMFKYAKSVCKRANKINKTRRLK